MPPGASNSAPTWAEGGRVRARGLYAALAAGALCLAAWSCATPAPRYTTARPQIPPAQAAEPEDTSRVRREETAEDDRKVDLAVIDARLLHPPDSLAGQPPDPVRDRVLLDVVRYLGAPYRHGGTTQDGMDCSGFTSGIFASAVNVRLPRSTADQYRVGTPVDRPGLRFGDLVFFNTTGRVPSHVGIYIEDDLFAHASVSFGVTFSSLESTYYRKRYVGARRILN